MKKEERTETITRIVYIASDGKEFDSEIDCEKYEEDLKATFLEESFQRLRVADCPTLVDLLDSLDVDLNGDLGAGWYVFKSDEDIELAERYAKYAGGARHLTPIQKNVPYLIILGDTMTLWLGKEQTAELRRSFEPPTV